MEKINKKTIIFDMDGTLYKFKGGSFKKSGLFEVIMENTILYISQQLKKTKYEARKILNIIMEKYGNSISIGLEKEFKINRHDYFNFAWDIDANEFVQFDREMRPFLLNLKNEFNLVLLSDAPMVWVNKVLGRLKIKDVFKDNIFSGEGDNRKEFDNAFQTITDKLNVKLTDCIVVGDQVDLDIIPAQKLGIKTVIIKKEKSYIADFTISKISELEGIIKKL